MKHARSPAHAAELRRTDGRCGRKNAGPVDTRPARVLLGCGDATSAARERAPPQLFRSRNADPAGSAARRAGRRPAARAGAGADEPTQSQLQYRIERLLGAGGFGQVYLAHADRTLVDRRPRPVCIKVERQRIDGWLREAYFGQLLDGHPRAIAVFDAFPLDARPTARLVYCLVLEYARHGDLRAYLRRNGSRLAGARSRDARSRASCRCSASCTAASCCTATSRR